ncbi:cytochrome c family oxidase subunit transmembrane domain protein [Cyclospora cayetanensis]|uniref:Cytochrome c family oxidase subunit transmembrane domain protein n=1 Tax=Cyclospora cayetanensis TaxID=88456 RepID=A0A1D3D683_9EIME|nr:cytochrome c family oxidase subunit transmembrane domain protein [Cyclospora cayetanensis]
MSSPLLPSSLYSTYTSFFSRLQQHQHNGDATDRSNTNNGTSKSSSFLPLATPPARLDHHESWRMFMGGHDPAAPYAESLINLHNHKSFGPSDAGINPIQSKREAKGAVEGKITSATRQAMTCRG